MCFPNWQRKRMLARKARRKSLIKAALLNTEALNLSIIDRSLHQSMTGSMSQSMIRSEDGILDRRSDQQVARSAKGVSELWGSSVRDKYFPKKKRKLNWSTIGTGHLADPEVLAAERAAREVEKGPKRVSAADLPPRKDSSRFFVRLRRGVETFVRGRSPTCSDSDGSQSSSQGQPPPHNPKGPLIRYPPSTTIYVY